MGLKWRLTLAYSIVLLFVMIVAALLYIRGARDDVRAEMQSTRLVIGHFLDDRLHAGAPARPGDPVFELARLAPARHLLVEHVDESGRVVESSRRAEDKRASVPDWFAALASPARAQDPIRRPVVVDGRQRGELVVTPDPGNEIAEKWQDAKELAMFALLLFLAVNAVVYVVVARSLRPIGRIVEMLGEIEGGNLRARVPPFAMLEFANIGGRCNRMADALERGAQQNRRLTLELIELQEQERRRLSRELHDELGQSVTAIQVNAAAIVRTPHRGDLVAESAGDIVGLAQRMLASIRGMLHRLRPEAFDELGLAAALRDLVDAWQRRNPAIACALELPGDLDIRGGDTALTLYRSVQEALTNVERHSAATRVDVRLRRSADASGERVMLAVRDNGRGATHACIERGFGLLGMRERVAALGGSLDIPIDARPGFRLEVALPLAHPAGT